MLVTPLHHLKTQGASGETTECPNNCTGRGTCKQLPTESLQPSWRLEGVPTECPTVIGERGRNSDPTQQEKAFTVVTYTITGLTLFRI